MSNLVKRIAVAIIGIPIALLLIFTGGIWFTCAIAIISTLGLYEYYNMAEKRANSPIKILGYSANIITIFVSYYFLHISKFNYSLFLIFITIICLIFLSMLMHLWYKKPNVLANESITAGAYVYITLSFTSLLMLREFSTVVNFVAESNIIPSASNIKLIFLQTLNYNSWAYFVLSLFAAVWTCDSAAYFTGMSIGRHKLFERISPKKTWEGAVGGLIGALIMFYLLMNFLIPGFSITDRIVIGCIVGILGQLGDLAESQLKRDAGIKDSSNIIPGHGGILDRFDSMLFIAPAVFIYMLLGLIF